MFSIADFKSSSITIIHGPNTQEILFKLLIESIINFDKDALFIDCHNSIDPYKLARITKSYRKDPKDILSRIHVSRAFTEYQMESITYSLQDAINRWNIGLLTISYMTSLFEDKRLFEILINHIKLLTKSFDIVTIITSFGNEEFDKSLTKNADRIIDIRNH